MTLQFVREALFRRYTAMGDSTSKLTPSVKVSRVSWSMDSTKRARSATVVRLATGKSPCSTTRTPCSCAVHTICGSSGPNMASVVSRDQSYFCQFVVFRANPKISFSGTVCIGSQSAAVLHGHPAALTCVLKRATRANAKIILNKIVKKKIIFILIIFALVVASLYSPLHFVCNH